MKKEEGFTLIEILIAIALLAFGLLAMASMQVMSIQTTGKANRITEGATMAMNQLELFMARGYNDADISKGVGVETVEENELYDIRWEVENIDDGSTYKTKHVKITMEISKHSLHKQQDIVLYGVVADNL